MRLLICALSLACALASSAHAASLVITHDPIPFALKGQPLTMKAKITGAATPQSVTLYYALFRDAAPFRVSMKSTGLGFYVGTIEANLLGGVESVSYYIEAQDADGALIETPWYEVKFREPRPSERPVAASPPPPAPAGPAPVIPVSDSSSDEASWKTPALVAGGAVLVLGGAYAISESGGGGGGGDDDDNGGGGGGGDSSTNAPGTYAGTVTTCTSPEGQPTTCDGESFTLLIGANQVVFSDTIRPGQQLTSPLNNNQFTFTAQVSGGGTNGVITYNGSWVNNNVFGQISGSATSAAGAVTYSGSFSASKQ
jgi:hypothetical protein